jgi:hypothetical protein
MVLNIKTALDECAGHAADIRRRNNTLVDYYIYPDPVPTAIAAYEPRLATLQSRITSIKKLNFSQLEQLIDDPDCLAGSHLNSIVSELLSAIVGYKRLFEDHYDPGLSERAPYTATYESLEVLQHRLLDLMQARYINPSRPRAEQILAFRNNSSSSSYQFCRSAIQVLNGNDRGRIANVSDKDLLSSNRNILADVGGAYLWWQCPMASCAFKLRFHILGSQASSIHDNFEIRSHPFVPLQYRSTYLIKSHLHISSDGAGTIKYGCLFCFAEGTPLQGGVSAFSNGRELAMHVCAAHRGAKLPPAMLLERAKLAVGGKCPIGVTRWDANFLTG